MLSWKARVLVLHTRVFFKHMLFHRRPVRTQRFGPGHSQQCEVPHDQPSLPDLHLARHVIRGVRSHKLIADFEVRAEHHSACHRHRGLGVEAHRGGGIRGQPAGRGLRVDAVQIKRPGVVVPSCHGAGDGD